MNAFSRFVLSCLFLSLLLHAPTYGQVTRYVTTTGTTPPASATSWATSTTNLQGAIDASQPGDQVWVAGGIYKPTTTTGPDSQTISFSMKNNVAIYGGFRGTELLLISRPATFPSSTTLSGEIGNPNSTSDNSYHVISNPQGLTATAVLDGFVITAGNATSMTGGGVFNNGNGQNIVCSPTFRNCYFVANSAQYGGGMGNQCYNGTSKPLLINCSFVGNSADLGGAMYNYGFKGGVSSPTLINCSFQNNSAQYGGAMYNNGREVANSNPQLTNCTFLNNTASEPQSGGALYNVANSSINGYSIPVLTNCILFGNGGNNTIYNYDSGSGVSASFCLFEASETDYISGPGSITTTVSPFAAPNSIVLDPNSPAINTGLSSASGLAGISTDLLGNQRVVGGQVDMGAVEYQVPCAIISLQADESGCPIRLVGRATGNSFVFTGPQGYVFSNTYRQAGTYDIFGLNVKVPGTYSLQAYCGNTPITQTVTVQRACP